MIRSRHIALLRALILFLLVSITKPAIARKEKSDEIKPPLIESVTIDGNLVFDDGRIHKLMISRPTSLLYPSRYHEELLKDDLRQIELFYQQNGYLEANVTGHFVVPAKEKENRVEITIQLKEGTVTRIEGISIFGNDVITEQRLLREIGLKKESPLIQPKVDDGVYKMLRLYAEKGYLETNINTDIRVDSSSHLALVDFIVEENIPYRVGDIRVEGLGKTRREVVDRELRFKRDETIKYSGLLESQRRLYLTGLFESVFVRPVDSQANLDSTKDIEIKVVEKENVELLFRVGFSSIEILRAGAELANNNLMGMNRNLSTTAQISFINRILQISFSEPYTWGTPWRTDVNLSTEYRQKPAYDMYRTGGILSVGRKIKEYTRVTFSYRAANVSLRNVRVLDESEEQDNRERALQVALSYDTRDNLMNPKRGVYFQLSNEQTGLVLGSTSQFSRTNLSGSGYFSLTSKTVLAVGAEGGWMDAKRGLSSIPLNERLYSGGPNSLRGFAYENVGPHDSDGNPRGGQFSIVVHPFELRQSVYKIMGVAAFVDVGNVWTRIINVRLKELRVSPGIGIRAETPIGLARVDYGINVNPHAGESSGQFYFSIGNAF